MTVYSENVFYSLQSASPGTGTGSAIDCRATRGFYGTIFVTGGSAIMTVQASHSVSGDSAWLPVVTVTATDGVAASAVSLNYYPYLRAFYSGYAGATASTVIARGIQ